MKPMRTLAAAATIASVAAAMTLPTTNAYSTSGYKWATNNVPFYVNPANGDVSQSAALSALQAGMDVWNSQAGTPFRFYYAGQTSATTTGYDQKNVIVFKPNDNGGTIATAYYWYSNGSLVDSDVVFWDGGWTFFSGQSGCNSGACIEDIAAHELGHSLGLKHSSVNDATMYPSYSRCSQSFRTLSSDDIAGAQSLYGKSSNSTDTVPVVTILKPASGATVTAGTALTFSGSSSDDPDGDLSDSLVWSSNIDGTIGTGASFSKALTAGSHTISATATDSAGQKTKKSVSVSVTSTTTNTAPSVTISSPANGASVPAGTSVTFSGSASDTQDGSLTTTLVWKSSIDGQIGTGGSFTRALTAGTHTITASVTDSGGLTGQKSITVSATSTSTTTSAKLSASGYKDKGMQKANLSWSGLSGTSVDVHRDGSKIGTTGNDGSMTDNIDKRGGGSYTYKVCAAGTSTCTNQASVSF